MCGISGVIDSKLSVDERTSAVIRMCAAMFHRGPDDEGIASIGPATIGMRRLAIFDPANGHQPMVTPDGRFTLIFNGAIYNFKKLRSALTAVGHSFQTECDTEVLLASYQQWGPACVTRLEGMFAFAVWDSRDESLFLARDPLGIKPLYFRQEGSQFIFASEIKALLASQTSRPEADPAAVSEFLSWLAVPAPRTIYRNIFSLCAGESAIYSKGTLKISRYWNFPKPAVGRHQARTREEFVAGLRIQLEETVRAHCLADVPVGAFLSGGLDSAVVVGFMAQVTATKLKTFSIGFGEQSYSEAEYAAQTAAHYGTEHHAIELTGRQVALDIGAIVGGLDQPTGDGINTYYASRAAREGGVTVALSGLGGDELFGGYPSFRDVPRIAGWLPYWNRIPGVIQASLVSSLSQGQTRHRKLADILRHARTLPEVASLQRRVFNLSAGSKLLSGDARRQIGSPAAFHPALATLSAELEGAGAFETVSAWELRTYMADVLLRDSDVMSMRSSLELRVPFVHKPFVEWLWSQPARFKEDLKSPKSVLAEAAAHLLPPGMKDRKKRGFTLPFPIWMKSDLRPFLDEIFSAQSIAKSGFFDVDAVENYWRRFLTGTDDRDWSRVWSLAVLISFVNRASPL